MEVNTNGSKIKLISRDRENRPPDEEILGAVINIILDPVFIFPLQMGMKGAAVATVMGQIVTAALSLWYLCHMKAVKLGKHSFGLWPGLMKRFLILGLTSFLAQISLVISMAAVQNMCTKYGALDPIFSQQEFAQIPLAVLGIVMKFFQIAISIAIGMAAGCIPVVGYNIGAGKKYRAKSLFTHLLVAEARAVPWHSCLSRRGSCSGNSRGFPGAAYRNLRCSQ